MGQIAQTPDGAALTVQLPQERETPHTREIRDAAGAQEKLLHPADRQLPQIIVRESRERQALQVGKIHKLREVVRVRKRELREAREIADGERAALDPRVIAGNGLQDCAFEADCGIPGQNRDLRLVLFDIDALGVARGPAHDAEHGAGDQE